MLTYSFIQHPIARIFESLESTFSGISEAFTVYQSYNKELLWKSLQGHEIEQLETKKNSHLIQRFRKSKSNYEWLSEADIYFLNTASKKKKKIKQLSFDDEIGNNILCLKFHSPIDHLYDCLFLKIENTSILGMSKQGSSFSVQEKNIIGKLLYQTFRSRIKEEYNNNDSHRLVLESIQMQRRNLELLEEENANIKNNYKKSVVYFIDSVLDKMSKKFDMKVALSEKALSYILEKDLNITDLEKILIHAAHMAANLTLTHSDTIIIQIENIAITQGKNPVATLQSNDKHFGIIEILDKYELAAAQAKAKNWKINGNTVASQCSPAITPSAITFNLKKYKKQINVLLDRYEEKWTLLRSEFKPLKNIIEHKKSELSKYKTA